MTADQPNHATHLGRTARLAVALGVCAMALCMGSGCCAVHRGIPVWKTNPEWLVASKGCERPVDLNLLRIPPQHEHVIAAKDILGVYVEGIVSGEEISSGGSELPTVSYYFRETDDLAASWPSVGQPFTVKPDGVVTLPLVGDVSLLGLTLDEAEEEIRLAYITEGQLKSEPNATFVQVSLISPRVNRILVVREDSPVQAASLIQRDQYVLSKRGEADVIELPADESDLLHALIATGGLPGEDAKNEVWILRDGAQQMWHQATMQFDQGMRPEQIACGGNYTVIPLRYPVECELPFQNSDIVLNDGDIIFVEKRIESHFYTGGLLNSGRIPLPRDEDIDILEAIALANDGVFGLSGQIALGQQGQFSEGPGNLAPATRAQVIRRLPGGQQVTIEIDVRRAARFAEERILIQPDDFVLLHYRPQELATNVLLNFFNFNVAFTRAL